MTTRSRPPSSGFKKTEIELETVRWSQRSLQRSPFETGSKEGRKVGFFSHILAFSFIRAPTLKPAMAQASEASEEEQGGLSHVLSGEGCGALFANYSDLDLARILHLILNLLGDHK